MSLARSALLVLMLPPSLVVAQTAPAAQHYFHAASSSYVTVLGRAAPVTDAAEKARRWKASWAPFYPRDARGSDFMLIRVTPSRLEISSNSRGMTSDPKTWLPVVIDFP